MTRVSFAWLAKQGDGVTREALQERIKVPTACICADGKMSGPSAQHKARGGGEEGRRRS
jgi:hypothetical protein